MNEIIIQAENLTKRYGDLTAVNNLSLEIFSGEVFGLLGPNGAGKTTSINMIVGLLKPDGGHVTIHGERVENDPSSVHSRVGVCPQESVLWNKLTCLEQLQFIGEMYGMKGQDARRRGKELLDILELSDKENKRASTLSGGMRRRLNLAMSLVHDPEILVLDEPEAGLDPQGRVLVREYIMSLAREKTIILTTHNMDEADRVSDRVAIIDFGKLLVVDTPEALKASVGAGDVVEINLEGQNGTEAIQKALALHKERVSIEITGNTLILRALDIVQLLPALMESLELAGLLPGEIRLRENTLEDVFIQLTGRRLRE
ncbi:MAG: ABC transporter ATP-binding protein [Anaerolineales bacterium]|nr:MAG: ABC transporter ATP-binding protein [Anaerolineales bacterium]